ncbi:hypothetical protein OEZ85_011853 [Tetradesmus obliquus]|uniref:Helicase ATP-binding domain-containing protein n=1 Tax=Tetradesmus obliquus TaxID=3088 RepID=A0ABY8TRJ6_TETOB|nr:hypothetical protein OEZ85_011853 [Tetradesmus obliquus]
MRVLVLAHRFELLHQAEEKFRLMWPACSVSWVKGQRKDFFGQVIVASVGTAVNCIPQLAQCRFSLVVVDEAHHSVANTYKAVLRGLGFVEDAAAPSSGSSSDEAESVGADRKTDVYADGSAFSGGSSGSSADDSQEESWEEWDAAAADTDGNSSSSSSSSSAGPQQLVMRAVNNPNSLCVGFTATPYRLREAESCELYEIFDNVFSKNISDMINAGYLSRIHSRRIFTHTHLKGAGGGSGGDFVISKLSPLVNSPGRNRLVLAAFLDYCCEPDNTAAHTTAAAAAADAPAAGVLAAAAAQRSSSRSSKSNRSSSSKLKLKQHDSEDEEEEEPAMDLSMAGKRAVRKAIGFAVDIEHAEALNSLFLQAGVCSGVVHSKRSIDEVKLDISRFRRGGLDVLWNCEKLTEGFDEPSISALLLARPTKSTGLYTQMLGRGLRRGPGKDNCLVLDFTDKQHKVDHIIDLRVLLPKTSYRNLDPRPPPPQQDRRRKLKLEGQQGGEMSVLGGDIDPYDMAFVRVGEHWSISMFDSGTVWLVNIAGMGAKQRRQLGLLQDASQPADTTAATAAADEGATNPAASAAAAAGAGSSREDDDEQAYEQEDRFVVLHQAPKLYDACSWTNAAPSAVRGMTESDAYGKALDFMQSLVRQQRAQQGRSTQASFKRSGEKGKPAFMGVPKVETFSKDAPWRKKPASNRQLEMLKQMQVELPPAAAAGSLTRGEASDLISQAKGALATPQQLQQLQAKLTAGELAGLPVPLLAEHAAALGAPRSSGLPPGNLQG